MRLALTLLLFSGVPLAAAGKGSILAVFAHPDDETTVGALMAKYAAAGHEVHLVSITSGQLGTTPNTKLSGDALGAARDEELRCSAKSLGIRAPILMHYQDQGISAPRVMEEIAGKLRTIINETKPQVVITWGADGVTGHLDHRVTSNIATQVFQQRGLLQHRPRKLYYLTFPESNFERSPQPGRPPFRTVSDEFITTAVDVTSSLDAAAKAIQCHKTQWDAARMSDLDAMNRKTLGGRVYLRLAMGDVPAPAGKRESDILEGIDLTKRAAATSVRAEHYADLKTSLIDGDVVFGVCSRGVPNATWSLEKCERALKLLDDVKENRLEKMVIVSSVEDLKWLIQRRPTGITWVAYNLERGMTSEPEFANPRAAVKEFARVGRAAGLKVIWGPTHAMLKADPALLELTRELDGMAFQHQKVLEFEGVPAFIELTRKRAEEVRRYNPSIRTIVQVVVGRGTMEQLVEGLRAVSGEVSEVKVFSMRDTGAIASILREVRGKGL